MIDRKTKHSSVSLLNGILNGILLGTTLFFAFACEKHKEHREEEKHGHHEKNKHEETVKIRRAALKQIQLEIYQVKLQEMHSQQIEAVGRVILPPSQISRVGSRAEGRLLKWFVRMGQRVRKGQALALLDSPTVGRARAHFLQAHAMHQLANIEFQRTQRLKKTGLASERMLLAARMTLKREEIKLRSASAQLRILGIPTPKNKKLERISGRFLLTAPSSGDITKMSHHLGAWVKPQSSILQIESRDNVWAQLEIYAQDVPQIRIGQSVHLYGPGIHPHRKGKISYLANRFDHGAQTLEARVVISNKDGSLRPNQFLHALIDSDANTKKTLHQHKAILVPEEAIQRLGQRQAVFVVDDEPGHFKVRTVVTTESSSNKVQVLYGLNPGDRVVSKGSFVLKSELMRASLKSEHGH